MAFPKNQRKLVQKIRDQLKTGWPNGPLDGPNDWIIIHTFTLSVQPANVWLEVNDYENIRTAASRQILELMKEKETAEIPRFVLIQFPGSRRKDLENSPWEEIFKLVVFSKESN